MNQTTIFIPGVSSPLITNTWNESLFDEIITMEDVKHVSILLTDNSIAVMPIALLDMAVYVTKKIE